MIFTERTITVRKGTSTINESIILYRGDFQVGLKFTILDSKYKFLNGANLLESEKATYAQLAVLKPKGDNIFSDIVKCSEGSVTFTMTKEMIDELEEVGKYSFQIRLFDANKESRVSIPPVEFGMEVREPVASEDHTNKTNEALTGYSIAKVTTIEEDKKVDTFDSSGEYNRTKWATGDRITENKLNKVEDALSKLNKNDKTLDNKINNNFNILDSTKLGRSDILTMSNMGQDVKEAMTGGSVAVVGTDAILTDNIVDGQVTPEKTSFAKRPGGYTNLFNPLSPDIKKGYMLNGGIDEVRTGMYISHKIPVKPNTKYILTRVQANWGGFYDENDSYIKKVGATEGGDQRNYVITTPSDTSYMKINGYDGDMDTYMVIEGTTMPSTYIPYRDVAYELQGISVPGLQDLQREVTFIKDLVGERKNLFNSNIPIEKGFYYDRYSKGPVSLSIAAHSYKIPIKQGKTYVYDRFHNIYGNNLNVQLYDKNGAFITNLPGKILDRRFAYVNVPDYDNIYYASVNMCSDQETINNFMFVEGDTAPEEYIPYDIPSDLTVKQPNMFDKDSAYIERGYYINGINKISSSAIALSHLIRVFPGKTYSYRFYTSALGTNTSIGAYNDKNVLMGVQNIVPTIVGDVATITMPSDTDVTYVRVNIAINSIDTFMFVEGNKLPDEYVPYGYRLKDGLIDYPMMSNNQESSINKHVFRTANLFDYTSPDIVRNQFLTSSQGKTKELANHHHTHLIPVEEGKSYTWPALRGKFGNNQQVAFYDKSGVAITGVTLTNNGAFVHNEAADLNTIFIQKDYNVKYIRVNTHEVELKSFMVVEGHEYPTSYIPYGIDMSDELKNVTKEIAKDVVIESMSNINLTSPLTGKIVAFNGDSICAASGATAGGGYARMISEKFDMTMQNIAVGGGTITAEQYSASTGNARHWISRTIDRMREDADYVILEGGVNDSSLKVPLGEVSSSFTASVDDTTFCGGLESICKQLYARFPDKKLGFIIVHKMTSTYDSTNNNYQYYNKTKEILEKWGIPYLDLNVECPPLNYIPYLKTTYTTSGDGWHPNADGYRLFYVDKIISFMERL